MAIPLPAIATYARDFRVISWRFHSGTCQMSITWTNSIFSNNVGYEYSSTPLQRETAVVGPSFLSAARNLGGPNSNMQDIQRRIGCGSKIHLFPSHWILQNKSHRRKSGSAFSMRVVKYWYKLPASVVMGPSVNIFKKRLDQVWKEVFPHLPVTYHYWVTAHFPNSLTTGPTPWSGHKTWLFIGNC